MSRLDPHESSERLRLFAARNPHREDRLTIVGPRLCGPAMALSDLADNIQAKTETTMPLVGDAPLKRLKKLHQSFPRDSGTAVAYLNANVSLFAHHRDAHRLVRCTVMDCICDEIPQQLLQASSVPGTLAVARDVQL
jgi:hypothetical protein